MAQVYVAYLMSSHGAQVALAGSITGDAMADLVEFAELFDIDMDQFTRVLALITPDRLGALQR